MVFWKFSLSALMLLVYTTAIGSNSQNSTETDENFILQEVRYYAPESATVYLLWKMENHSQEESVLWNDETTFKDEYLCNLLIPENDTFRIRIKVHKNSTLEYYFWITKNKQ